LSTRPECVCLALGSNIGDREAHLRRAVRDLEETPLIQIDQVSPIFESDYVGPGEQQPYLNLCLSLKTTLEPVVMLDILQAQERTAGRRPDTHMQPRTLDLDILLWNDRIIDLPRLQVPHPRLLERAFVLEPLAVIVPEHVVPGTGRAVVSHLAALSDGHRAGLRPWPDTEPSS
jgi:2-amino-4-hydroxy-6-hydroxymethyldihydropteridine diphosphokinase